MKVAQFLRHWVHFPLLHFQSTVSYHASAASKSSFIVYITPLACRCHEDVQLASIRTYIELIYVHRIAYYLSLFSLAY